jgi:hypothetical protein
MPRTGQPAAVDGLRGTTGPAGHGDTAVTTGARPDGRVPRSIRACPAAAPALVRRP